MVSSLSEAVELLDDADRPALGIQFDSWHVWNSPEVVQDIQRRVPEATVVLREHVLSSKQHESVSLTVFSVLVTKKHGPFVLRREYVVVDSQHAADAPS